MVQCAIDGEQCTNPEEQFVNIQVAWNGILIEAVNTMVETDSPVDAPFCHWGINREEKCRCQERSMAVRQ
jgi:hypothetical protein